MKNTIKVSAIVLLFALCSFAPDWLTIQNAPGRFKVLFPRQPIESTEEVPTEIGKLKMKMFMCDESKYKDDNEMYGLIYSDYPDTLVSSDFKDEILDKFFNASIEGAEKNISGTEISRGKVTLNGFPGRQVKVSFAEGKGLMYMRMYLVNHRVYFLQVGCTTEKDNNTSINKFFNSFALTGKK